GLRGTRRDAHAGRHQVDAPVPRRGGRRPAHGQGVLVRRDTHHVPDGLVRRSDRDPGLGGEELLADVSAGGAEAIVTMSAWGRWWCGVVVMAMAFAAAPARASNHLVIIDQVLASWQGSTAVQFVMLRMLAPGEGNLSLGASLVFDDETGSAASRRF